MESGFVYLISNFARTVIYIGMTNDLNRRILEHKSGQGSKFTTKYNCTDLLYFEELQSLEEAAIREKRLKGWRQKWKWELVQKDNADLLDLALDWFDEEDIAMAKKVF
ncbi:MAG: GIY-YIG nuclease family protein [Bacteroidetes bacterium]|nr:GIY-YIG nuclease family protein [Bacteroidota bacterium]